MSDAEKQRAILEEAVRDPKLLAVVPAVVAAGFGVLPLRRQGDLLTVACLPRAGRRALRALREVLGLDVVATPYDEKSLHEAIRAAYFAEDESVNFPTFTDPDFLDDPASAPALREEKVERPGEAALELPPGQLLLASLGYRSTLRNLDAPRSAALPDPRRTRLELGALDAGWTRDALGAPRVAAARLDGGARLVLDEWRETDYRHIHGGRVGEHEVRSTGLARLPHVIHPTEVQLVRAGPGGLGIHAYDRLHTVAPGQRARLVVSYYFLSYGSRLHREIVLDVQDVVSMARHEVRTLDRPPWGPVELARWLGVAAAGPTAPRE